jgi:Zn-finger nucleic acid-binding protein
MDRLIPRGQPAVIDCPHCEQRLMLGTIDERRVLYCESCSGILVPMADFAEVVQGRRRSYRGADQTPRPLAAEQLQQQIGCPGCARTMEVHPYYGPGAVVIDSCRACRLVWLDSGELARIERAPGRR